MSMHRIPVIVAAVVLSYVPIAAQQTPEKQAKPPAWYTPLDQVKRLGPEVKVDAYSIRPPAGFEMKSSQRSSPTEGETLMYGWIGPSRLDGSHPFVSLGILKPPKGGKMPALERALSTQLAMTAKRRKDFRSETPERGTIGGLACMRVRHVGTDLGSDLRVNGVLYVYVGSDAIVVLITQGVGERPNADVELAEASILTFRRAAK